MENTKVSNAALQKWLDSVCVDIKDEDFNTTPRGHKLHNSEYWEEYNEYIDSFENC